LVYQTLKITTMSLFSTPPYEKEEPNLCEECGGIIVDEFCEDCGSCFNDGSDADDYYEEWRNENF